MKITILTPVHIGSGQVLTEDEYWSVGSSPSHQWARTNLAALIEAACGDDDSRYAEVARQLETRDGLIQLLQGLDPSIVSATALYRCNVDQAVIDHIRWRSAENGRRKKAHQERLEPVEIHECLKARCRAFLPGSSLKGAMLTALYWSQYSTLDDARARLGNTRNPERTGLSRRLRPSDTLGAAKLTMHLCRRVMRNSDGELRAIELWVECLSAGQELRAELARPLGQESRLPQPLTREDIENMCRAANSFAKAVARKDLAHMRRYEVPRNGLAPLQTALSELRDSGADTGCLLRVGWGVGQAATSVKLLDEKWANDPRPKTRWFVANPVGDAKPSKWAGERAVPLGWVRIDFEESDYV